jgi:hypothetical protein
MIHRTRLNLLYADTGETQGGAIAFGLPEISQSKSISQKPQENQHDHDSKQFSQKAHKNCASQKAKELRLFQSPYFNIMQISFLSI